jgi:plasmid maintenance system killer protein
VIIKFRTNTLRRRYERKTDRHKAWGKAIAGKYVDAVNLLKAVEHPSHLAAFRQFAYEPLREDRKGEYSLKLGERARLIFTVSDAGTALVARIEEVDPRHYGH